MPTIHYRYLHQHPQSFVTLNSPSPFDAAPQNPMYPADYLSGTGSRRTASFLQTATTRGTPHFFIFLFFYLFIFLSATIMHAKSNTDLLHVQIRLLSRGPLRQFSSSTFSTSHAPLLAPTIAHSVLSLLLFASNLSTHICFSSISFNITSLPDQLDQMLLIKATTDPGAHFAD